MFFSILPVREFGVDHSPAIVKTRWNPSGINAVWSWKDFGVDSSIGLLISDIQIPGALFEFDDVFAPITGQQRANLAGVLRDGNIEPSWAAGASNSHRESLHKLCGMTQAKQANRDDPDRWLIKPVYCGALGAIVPFDARGYEEAQQKELDMLQRLSPYPITKEGRLWYMLVPPGHYLKPEGGRVFLGGGALPATDAFTNTDGTNLGTHSANWSEGAAGHLKINTNSVYSSAVATETVAGWNADTFNNNQYSKATCVAMNIDTSFAIGVATRKHTTATTYTYYLFYGNGTESFLAKNVANTWTQLGLGGAAWVTSAVYEQTANSTTITPKKDGATFSSIGAQTDSSITSGRAGLAGYGNTTLDRMDDWEGGDISVAAASILFDDRRQRFQSLIVR